MRHRHALPDLPFDLGTLVFSPGIIAALPGAPALRVHLDHMLELHSCTEFGIIARSTRLDNVVAALLGAGQLTSRYFLSRDICPPQDGIIVTTHLELHTTTIRFASEQQ